MGDDVTEPTGPSIWVIESGSYSGYRVVGVFSTKANAERAAALMSDAEVSEWPLDPGLDELNQGRTPWLINMTPTGDVTRVEPAARNEHRWPELEGMTYRLGWTQHSIGQYHPPHVTGTVWASDEAHAIKIANEYRIQARAEGKI